MKKEKILTYIVLLWLLFGIGRLNTTNLWSWDNWFSFLGLIVFLVYLAYSLKKAASEKKNQTDL